MLIGVRTLADQEQFVLGAAAGPFGASGSSGGSASVSHSKDCSSIVEPSVRYPWSRRRQAEAQSWFSSVIWG